MLKDRINDQDQKIEQKIKDTETQNNLRIRDSLSVIKSDSSNQRIVRSFSEGLASYYLKYDSSQKTIQRLVKDSAKRNTQITYGADPVLQVCIDKGIKFIKDDFKGDYIKIHFCNYQNTAKNIKVKVYGFQYNVPPNDFNALELSPIRMQLPNNSQMIANQVTGIDYALNEKDKSSSVTIYRKLG